MIETITFITLTLVLLALFRPGKTPPLDNPLVIERPGQYHMALAPQLNLVQPFIEDIARRFDQAGPASCATQFFAIRDKEVAARDNPSYFLAITRYQDMLYFQATSAPGKLPIPYDNIFNFAAATLAKQGISALPDHPATADAIRSAVHAAAPPRNATITALTPPAAA